MFWGLGIRGFGGFGGFGFKVLGVGFWDLGVQGFGPLNAKPTVHTPTVLSMFFLNPEP